MNNFFKLSQSAKREARKGNLSLSFDFYKSSLDKYPSNIYLIREMINNLGNLIGDQSIFLEIEDLIEKSLFHIGERENIFKYHDLVNFLRHELIKNHIYFRYDLKNSKNFKFKVKKILIPDKIKITKIKRIGILSCFWRRESLNKIFLQHLNYLRENLRHKLEIMPLIVGSEGLESKNICRDFNVNYIEHPNNPLSKKWDAGINFFKNKGIDGLIILGSDDFISESILKFYSFILDEGVQISGFTDAYFFDLKSEGNLIHWKGYGGKANLGGQPDRLCETIGMARLISAEFLEKINYSIWGDIDINSGLDKFAQKKFNSKGYIPIGQNYVPTISSDEKIFCIGTIGFKLNETNNFAVDIKTNQNLTSINKYMGDMNSFERIYNPLHKLQKNLNANTFDSFLNYRESI